MSDVIACEEVNPQLASARCTVTGPHSTHRDLWDDHWTTYAAESIEFSQGWSLQPLEEGRDAA